MAENTDPVGVHEPVAIKNLSEINLKNQIILSHKYTYTYNRYFNNTIFFYCKTDSKHST